MLRPAEDSFGVGLAQVLSGVEDMPHVHLRILLRSAGCGSKALKRTIVCHSGR